MPSTHRPLDVYPITTRVLEVLRVADVTPGMRRVTLGGEQLAAHTADNGFPVAAFRSEGFDDEFKLILKHPDSPVVVGPTQNDGVLDWPRGDDHLVFRTYTVRRWDREAGELDIDLVIHGIGAAATWARTVQPGESVQIAGPKMSAPHPQGVDWVLVGGDETALPAIGRMLETWPAGLRAQVFIEVERDSHRQDLPVPDGVELTWLTRDGAPAGTTTLLLDAITATPWWDGTCFAWLAGEASTLTPIRRWLRREKGMDPNQLDVTGYWRRREVDEETALATNDPHHQRFGELTELMPAFAIRVAATLGVGDVLASSPATIEEVAAATGAHPVGLVKLLRYLQACEVVEVCDGRWSLSPLGNDLGDDEETPFLDLDRVHARREVGAAMSLLDAVRSGTPASWFGQSWSADVAADPRRQRDRVTADESTAEFVAGALAVSAPLHGHQRIAVLGRGAASVARALCSAHPTLCVEVVGTPAELEVLADLHPPQERVTLTPGDAREPLAQTVDVVLLLDMVTESTDADVTQMLRSAAQSVSENGVVALFGELMPEPADPAETPDEHDCEDDLVAFVLTGGGLRTETELTALLSTAGLTTPTRTTIGWGYGLYTCTPDA